MPTRADTTDKARFALRMLLRQELALARAGRVRVAFSRAGVPRRGALPGPPSVPIRRGGGLGFRGGNVAGRTSAVVRCRARRCVAVEANLAVAHEKVHLSFVCASKA